MKPNPRLLSATWLGPACGLAAAVLYTLTNIALRDCVDVDAYLVSAVKAAPTVIFLGPVVMWMAMTGKPMMKSKKRLPQFLFASILAQFFGNAAFQKALEKIGLAASVPITLGVLLVGGAIFGIFLLGESVSRQKTISMITLIAAVVVLSIPQSGSAPKSSEPEITTQGQLEMGSVPAVDETRVSVADVLIGSLWAAASGLAYSFFGVSLRQTLQSGVSSATAMLVSGLVGTIALWPYVFLTLGSETITKVGWSTWITMSIAGSCNFLAFIAITASLRLLPVVAVNLINASQVAMAAMAGVLLFREPFTWTLLGGILLTIAGLIIMAIRPSPSHPVQSGQSENESIPID